MNDAELLQSLSTILADLLGDDSIELHRETRREDVPGWDSFNYVNFIVAVEMEYDVKFRVSDVEAFLNVGEIVDALQSLANR